MSVTSCSSSSLYSFPHNSFSSVQSGNSKSHTFFVSQYCRDRPESLPSIEVILGNDDKKGGPGGRGGKSGRGGGAADSWSRGQQPFATRGRGGPPGMPGMFPPVPNKYGYLVLSQLSASDSFNAVFRSQSTPSRSCRSYGSSWNAWSSGCTPACYAWASNEERN